MSMQDPISDMLTQIRNSQNSKKKFVKLYSSKQKKEICQVLKNEGFIKNFYIYGKIKLKLSIELKYYKNKPVVDMIKRISKPGLRIYKSYKKIPKVFGGLGIAIISTSKGMMTDHSARNLKLGGEVICYIA